MRPVARIDSVPCGPIMAFRRVLFVIPSYAPFVGGAQTLVARLAEGMIADGRSVAVLTTTARRAPDLWSPPSEAERLTPGTSTHHGVTVRRLALGYLPPAPYGFAILRRLSLGLGRLPRPVDPLRARLLRHIARWLPPIPGLESELADQIRAADLVYVVDAGWDGLFTHAVATARRLERPCLAFPLIHTGSPAIRAHFTMPHQVVVYRQVDALVVLAQAEAQVLRSLGVPPERIHRVDLGVTPPTRWPTEQDLAVLRRTYGLDGPWVLFLGAATRDKGAFTLLEAGQHLWAQGRTCHLVYAGPQQEVLAAQVRDLPPTHRQRVHLLGVVDETTKHGLLAGAVALALPSRVDTFGLAVLEAWQHGLPVVVAQAGGLAERVRPGVTGLQVPYGRADRLAQALAVLLDHPEEARRMGQRGREALHRYTWKQTYAQLCAIEEHIARRRAAHRAG